MERYFSSIILYASAAYRTDPDSIGSFACEYDDHHVQINGLR